MDPALSSVLEAMTTALFKQQEGLKKEPKEHETTPWQEWTRITDWEDSFYQFRIMLATASGRPAEVIHPWITAAVDDNANYKDLENAGELHNIDVNIFTGAELCKNAPDSFRRKLKFMRLEADKRNKFPSGRQALWHMKQKFKRPEDKRMEMYEQIRSVKYNRDLQKCQDEWNAALIPFGDNPSHPQV